MGLQGLGDQARRYQKRSTQPFLPFFFGIGLGSSFFQGAFIGSFFIAYLQVSSAKSAFVAHQYLGRAKAYEHR